ncbi:hypothetical protein CANARDRAFT_227892 [[Candida] arabinofermentans NRRL YB-2248]|uniref:Prefoldin subunit 4 n=1 Tax=[Candida] arabinofermentans NRRL YB-2248 TaxID=983967 RepID=A0A1E4T7I9_9ASCO|nr:hypothetical protein CANARDRAFT_227892 [[Candida] arabinofermentans NRRL YB-2248]
MELLPEGETNTTQVTWQDQQKINKFSLLVSKKDTLTTTLDNFKQEKEYIDDLSLEIELVDEDEKLNYKIGDSFILLKQSEIVNRLEISNDELDGNINKLQSEIDEIDDELNILKKQLYATFGNAINLER